MRYWKNGAKTVRYSGAMCFMSVGDTDEKVTPTRCRCAAPVSKSSEYNNLTETSSRTPCTENSKDKPCQTHFYRTIRSPQIGSPGFIWLYLKPPTRSLRS